MGRSDFEGCEVGWFEEDVDVRLDVVKVGISKDVDGLSEGVVGGEVGNDECEVHVRECWMYVVP